MIEWGGSIRPPRTPSCPKPESKGSRACLIPQGMRGEEAQLPDTLQRRDPGIYLSAIQDVTDGSNISL